MSKAILMLGFVDDEVKPDSDVRYAQAILYSAITAEVRGNPPQGHEIKHRSREPIGLADFTMLLGRIEEYARTQLEKDPVDPPSGEIVSPQDMKVLVVGQNVWGIGDTLNEALAKARQQGSSGSVKHYVAYIATADTRVDEMGRLCYPLGSTPKEFHKVDPPKKDKKHKKK